MSEKASAAFGSQWRSYSWRGPLQALVFVGMLGFFGWNQFAQQQQQTGITLTADMAQSLCPQPTGVDIVEHDKVQWILKDETYRETSAGFLSGAIQVDTTIFDDTSDFTKWLKFHEFLKEKFPLVHKYAKIHKVNTYNLLFEFEGSDEDLKPVVFMAHQDTVPIGDPKTWLRDPFGGDYDGEKVYGRGASDCKNLLTGLMESVELLLQDGKTDFKRTFFLSFGFDEEISGHHGAVFLSNYLVDYLGENSVEYITDEGPYMFNDVDGDYYGYVMTGEKGYLDVFVNLNAPGGHSSNPRDHTSIGMMSTFLHRYEKYLYEPSFVEDTPWKGCLNCMAAHGQGLNDELKQLILKSKDDVKIQAELLDYLTDLPEWKYSIRTSQAIDIIFGGDKANSLPREVSAVINHRVAYGNSLASVKHKVISIGKQTAEEYGIGFSAFGIDIIPENENGLLNVTSQANFETEPVRASPTVGEAWDLFAGSIKSFYEQEVFPEKFEDGKSMILTPSMFPGNTDMRHYLKLSPNLFRSQPGSISMADQTAHDHDEWMSIDSHLEIVAFYYNHISDVCL